MCLILILSSCGGGSGGGSLSGAGDGAGDGVDVGGSGPGGGADADAGDGSGADVGVAADAVDDVAPSRDVGEGDMGGGDAGRPDPDPSTPHVEIRGGALRIDGEPTFLYGGDLHYFRVRDENFDAERTHELWGRGLDQMRAAGMNLVSTYIPWDYHNPREGEYDFEGARDLNRFVDMACERGMKVILKPGPLITGEWPRGAGTFGAVPAWWKADHEEALARDANGNLFNSSDTRASDQQQPSILHPTYLASVRRWYEEVFPKMRPYLGGCLVAIQLDNETNLYWGNRFGGVDYSDVALAHYREFLRQKYSTIADLNAVYSQSYNDFDEVEPPSNDPGPRTDRALNPWYADWYWAGQAYVGAYLQTLKEMAYDQGFRPPEVLYFTNDSPFTLLAGDISARNVLLHDGLTKNRVANAAIDLYPKQTFTNDNLQDQPFQSDYFVRLYDQAGDLATGPQEFVFGAELQGGFYRFPVVGHPTVRPQATDQLHARTIGRGLKGGAFYVIQDGLNLDNSPYDYLAAIDAEGQPAERYPVFERWGRFLGEYGAELLEARELIDSVAILTHGHYAAPQGGVLDNMQRHYTVEYPALFGWLINAGFNPAVLDARLVDVNDLSQYSAVIYLNPDFVETRTARMLIDYTNQGGFLINMLWPGRQNETFSEPDDAALLYATLFPLQEQGSWQWLNPARSGEVNLDLGDGPRTLDSYWYATFWSDPGGDVFAYERSEPFGGNGDPVGFFMDDAQGARAFVGTNSTLRFNQDDYYVLRPERIEKATAFARFLLQRAGLQPSIRAQAVRHLVWARRTSQTLFLFVVNDNESGGPVRIFIDDLNFAGLQGARLYTARDALSGQELGDFSGTQLQAGQLEVDVDGWSTAVVVLKPAR